MGLTLKELHEAHSRELHKDNLKLALASVLEDLHRVDGLLATLETELLESAGPVWRAKGLTAILNGTGLPSDAVKWRVRYLYVRDWMKTYVPCRLESQERD